MTKRKVMHESTHERSFEIATDMLLRCERFIRDIAFFKGEKLSLLAREFYENLFLTDHRIFRYYKESKELDNYEYRLLSEINEQLTDYAFLVSQHIHPWDVPDRVQRDDGQGREWRTAAEAVRFPPAGWVNRMERKTLTPLAGYPLEKSDGQE